MDAREFTSLSHAYGRATDTPAHLAALAGDDPVARDAALAHLWSAIIHQGTPWLATPPAARAVATLLAGDRPADADVRANLLRFLAAVAEAGRRTTLDDDLTTVAALDRPDIDAAITRLIEEDDDELWEDAAVTNALHARAVLGCRDVTPSLFTAILPRLSDPDPTVRATAAYAGSACCVTTNSASDTATLAERLEALATHAGPDERAALVLAMGDLGLAPRGHLDDQHPGVRACAALAPALADDPAATAELFAALADPADVENWFTHRPPQLRGRIRFSLVGALIERVSDPDRLLPAALAIAPIANQSTVRSDWGRLLKAIFAVDDTGHPSEAGRRYLGALVDNPDLWNRDNGTVGLAFKEAGLPFDRDACRELTHSGTVEQ